MIHLERTSSEQLLFQSQYVENSPIINHLMDCVRSLPPQSAECETELEQYKRQEDYPCDYVQSKL